MTNLSKWITDIPWIVLLFLTVLMALAPFGSTPHLVEKWRMLFAGTLRRPLDWFDLVLHTSPIVLVIIKLIVTLRAASPAPTR
jgi:hypothetical protein